MQVKLTPELDRLVDLARVDTGVTCYESAQRMLAEAARVRQLLASRQADGPAAVVLGASPTLARVLLPGLFVKVRLVQATSENAIRLPDGQPLARGERIVFAPGHIDPTLDRYDLLHLVQGDVLVDVVLQGPV